MGAIDCCSWSVESETNLSPSLWKSEQLCGICFPSIFIYMTSGDQNSDCWVEKKKWIMTPRKQQSYARSGCLFFNFAPFAKE